MSKKSITIQQTFERDDAVSHYIAESDRDSTFLRRGEGEEWTAWCRGEPLVDIADHGNGIYVDIHRTKQGNIHLNMDYDTISDLYLALQEHLMHTDEGAGGKMIVKRFLELTD